ncbi:hypothetical protein BOTCAL_0243g00110 [Botryotinia calthae]|uniref:Uncharacterized protein n=1 Tax=Botryotinia calthae TaxID=38488 RepID=A0A4Y8CX17_9HELO|nr:hypothetical protein BOTCAL_0243g00110 [Botryotinia calthae]
MNPKKSIIGSNDSKDEGPKPKRKRLIKKRPSTHTPTSPNDLAANQTTSPSTGAPSNREDLDLKSKARAKNLQELGDHEARPSTTLDIVSTPSTPSQRHYPPPQGKRENDISHPPNHIADKTLAS